MPDPLNLMPDTINKGDSFSVLVAGGDYVSPTWTLTCYLIGATNNANVIATQSGSDHLLTFTTAITDALTAEFTSWQMKVGDGTDLVTVDTGTLTVKANFASIGASDQRSHARIAYDAICAVIEGRASKDQEEYSIKDRSLKRTSLADLVQFKSYYGSLVSAEDRQAKGEGNRLIKTRFNNP